MYTRCAAKALSGCLISAAVTAASASFSATGARVARLESDCNCVSLLRTPAEPSGATGAEAQPANNALATAVATNTLEVFISVLLNCASFPQPGWKCYATFRHSRPWP